MQLFFSDLHLGRGERSSERELERSFVRCLESHREEVEELFLVGDIFDQFIEYRHTIPKGGTRLMGLLARWADDGLPITYLVGNHDPWHQSYFREEMGVQVESDDVLTDIEGLRVYISHGDSHDPSSSMYRTIRPLLRHSVPVFLYRYLLPGDTGYSLARWVNQTFHGDELDSNRIEGLRGKARHILCSQEEVDLVVFGHSHHPEIRRWDEGSYLNPGAWRQTFTYGMIEGGSIKMLQWNGSTSRTIEPSE